MGSPSRVVWGNPPRQEHQQFVAANQNLLAWSGDQRGVPAFPEIVFIWLVFVWFWMNNCTLLFKGIMKDPPQESL